jgi:hypothetical protein
MAKEQTLSFSTLGRGEQAAPASQASKTLPFPSADSKHRPRQEAGKAISDDERAERQDRNMDLLLKAFRSHLEANPPKEKVQVAGAEGKNAAE